MTHFGYIFSSRIVQWSKKSSIWIRFGWQGTTTMLRKQVKKQWNMLTTLSLRWENDERYWRAMWK